MIVRSDWKRVEELSRLIPTNEQPRFRMLLAALNEVPIELQKKIAKQVFIQLFPAKS